MNKTYPGVEVAGLPGTAPVALDVLDDGGLDDPRAGRVAARERVDGVDGVRREGNGDLDSRAPSSTP